MYNQNIYLNDKALNVLLTEGYLDAIRTQLKSNAKNIAAKKAALYYTWKNGKLFLFFDKNTLGIKDSISLWVQSIWNKFLRFLTGTKINNKEIEEFKIKKGADITDVKQVLEYYEAKKQLDAITYNKLCNTWSYIVMPFVKGSRMERYYRAVLKRLNGRAIPDDVLKDPKILNKQYFHCGKSNKK